jgi:hypothetical protein
VTPAHQPPGSARLRAGDILEHRFALAEPGEAWVALTLSAPAASWLRAETAVVTLAVDGRDRQEIILAAGDEPVEYARFLGRRSRGAHVIQLETHSGLSSPVIREVAVTGLRTGCVGDDDPSTQLWRYAPVIHYRALDGPLDSLTTDTPLLLFYRRWVHDGLMSLEYHVVFSHEDAGTDLTGLLARWGHTVDIEWVFRVTLDGAGGVISEEFQGPHHVTHRYRGGRAFGGHPILQVATHNGTVEDRVICPYRTALAPACAQPADEPREGVLQQFPWVYRVSAMEVLRQVPLEVPPVPDAPAPGDLRAYLFLQWKRVRGPVVPLEACVRVGGRWYTSAWGREDLVFDDPDAESTAVKMPPTTTEAQVSAISLRAKMPIGETVQVALVRAFFLGEEYRPRPSFAGPAVCLLDAAAPEQVVWARQ